MSDRTACIHCGSNLRTIEERIKKFATDPEVVTLAWAMLKVGSDKGDEPEEIMSHVIALLLMQFNGIPLIGAGCPPEAVPTDAEPLTSQ